MDEHSHKNKDFLLFLSAFALLFITGCLFFSGMPQSSSQESVAPAQTKAEQRVKELEDEIQKILNNQADHVGDSKYPYEAKKFGLTSPLFEGKEINVSTYKYKRNIISEKNISIASNSGIALWEAETAQNFATFDGYENWFLNATGVEEIKKAWTESYTTKNGVKMYYGYEWAPKYIGVVTLSSYQEFFLNYRDSKPSLVKIWVAPEGYASTKNDPSIIRAKKELNKIADQIEFGLP